MEWLLIHPVIRKRIRTFLVWFQPILNPRYCQWARSLERLTTICGYAHNPQQPGNHTRLTSTMRRPNMPVLLSQNHLRVLTDGVRRRGLTFAGLDGAFMDEFVS
jgi:hypothetical protein